MTVGNWIAIVVPIIGLLGAAALYMVQKYLDRKNEIQSERRKLYRETVQVFRELELNILFGTDHNKCVELQSDIACKFGELLVSAPDSVVQHLLEVEGKIASAVVVSYSRNDIQDLSKEQIREKIYSSLLEAKTEFEKVIRAMREDSFEGTRFSNTGAVSKLLTKSIADMLFKVG